jgi:3-phenylpropionate/trans-cinnamate dioxygenase ferredoxin reductase subunit
MPVVKADHGQCQGYANCVAGADDTFDLDDDGVVVVLRPEIPEEDRARVKTAALSCPVSVLTVSSE